MTTISSLILSHVAAFMLAWLRIAASKVFHDCDQMFIHTTSGIINGTFSSPGYSQDSTYEADLQCVYTFVAMPQYRVSLSFTDFALSGSSTHCNNDYLDIYSELASPELDLLEQTLSGRYCGSVSPRGRVSLHHVIVLVFHTRSDGGISGGAERGFIGNFSFTSADKYTVGTPEPDADPIGFIIRSREGSQGKIISPTYPGTYPKNFYTYYKFLGMEGQRVRLYLRDFDLFFGGNHCPYDYVTFYDGETRRSPIIKKVCGLQQKMELYSVGSTLFVEFNTTNPPSAEHRGFLIEYSFSNSYVDIPRLIGGAPGVSHLRGTHCDIRVKSNKETSNIITSPNYPQLYPPNTTCVYILDGLEGVQDLEKVQLKFQTFSIPSATGDCSDPPKVSLHVSVSSDWKNEKPEFELCSVNDSKRALSETFYSTGSRLIMIFNTSSSFLQGQGFKAKVQFVTDYGIPGLAVGNTANKCHFSFHSRNSVEGSFNSPRYPSEYPVDTNCTYTLEGRPNERVRIYFEQFTLSWGLSKGDKCNDHVKLFDVFVSQKDPSKKEKKYKAKYCADSLPGPHVSAYGSHEMEVLFSSNSQKTATGFKINYDFAPAPKQDIPKMPEKRLQGQGGCGGQNGGMSASWFASPNYNTRYNHNLVCKWEIRVRRGYRILLLAHVIDVEGNMATMVGNMQKVDCQSAVIRVYPAPGKPFEQEVCGTNVAMVKPIISEANIMRITFLTAPKKVNGLKGFNFTWTEVRSATKDQDCNQNEFKCIYSLLCIDKALQCNGEPNCGEGDTTDESHCEPRETANTQRTIILAAVAGGLVLVVVCVIGCFLLNRHFGDDKKKKRKGRERRKRHNNAKFGAATQHTSPSTSAAAAAANLLGRKRGVQLQDEDD